MSFDEGTQLPRVNLGVQKVIDCSVIRAIRHPCLPIGMGFRPTTASSTPVSYNFVGHNEWGMWPVKRFARCFNLAGAKRRPVRLGGSRQIGGAEADLSAASNQNRAIRG
jgi:hypothetical protein